jgi:hypothetical protein
MAKFKFTFTMHQVKPVDVDTADDDSVVTITAGDTNTVVANQTVTSTDSENPQTFIYETDDVDITTPLSGYSTDITSNVILTLTNAEPGRSVVISAAKYAPWYLDNYYEGAWLERNSSGEAVTAPAGAVLVARPAEQVMTRVVDGPPLPFEKVVDGERIVTADNYQLVPTDDYLRLIGFAGPSLSRIDPSAGPVSLWDSLTLEFKTNNFIVVHDLMQDYL